MKSLLTFAALLFLMPSVSSAQICVQIFAYGATERELEILRDVNGRAYSFGDGTIRVGCVDTGEENDFERSMRRTAETNSDRAWRSLVDEAVIRRVIRDNGGGNCPSILEDVTTLNPFLNNGVLEVSCTNGNRYRITNWGDERNFEDGSWSKLVVAPIENP